MDETSRMIYMQQRYLDPAGFFLSPDPIGASASSFNRYWYANNNPYTFVDPDGREPCTGSRVSCPTRTGSIGGGIPARSQTSRSELAKQAVGRDGRMMLRMFTAPVDYVLSTYEAVQEGDAVGIAVAAAGLTPTGAIARVGNAAKAPIWSANKIKSAVENAFSHWKKHASEFPELKNAKQYVDAARSMAAHPPAGALMKARGADTLIYDQASNTFLVRGADGAPHTMFRPENGIDYWNRQ